LIKTVFPGLSALVIEELLDEGTMVLIVARAPVTAAAYRNVGS
jgi:hypothetical protein